MEPVDLVRLPEESRRSPPRRVPPPNRRGGADHAAGRHEGDLVERLDLRCERPDWAAAAREQRRTGEYARLGWQERFLRARRVRAEERRGPRDPLGAPDDAIQCRRPGPRVPAHGRHRGGARRRSRRARVGELRPPELEYRLRRSYPGGGGELSPVPPGGGARRRYEDG